MAQSGSSGRLWRGRDRYRASIGLNLEYACSSKLQSHFILLSDVENVLKFSALIQTDGPKCLAVDVVRHLFEVARR